MSRFYVTDIDWELDGEDVEAVKLPKETVVDASDEDGIADALSDKFGWLVNSFSVQRAPKALPCTESAFSDVAPIYAGDGAYLVLGKVTADDGITYPFLADLSDDDVYLLDTCPYDLPADEQGTVLDSILDYYDWPLDHCIAEYSKDDVAEFMCSLCEYIVKHDDEVFQHSWSSYATSEIEQLLDGYKSRMEKYHVSYEKLLDMFVNYVINDAEAAELDYVQEALESAGCDEETAKKLGLGWVFGEEE